VIALILPLLERTKASRVLKTSTQEIIMSISQVGRELNASIAANKATLELIRGQNCENLAGQIQEAISLHRRMALADAEIQDLIEATAKATGERERNPLKERTKAVTAAWLGNEINYTETMVGCTDVHSSSLG
jgi:hypothetical protein